MQSKVKLGIVGCGVIGPKHAGIIAKLPHTELVAVADVIPARADALASEYGCRAYHSYEELLQQEDIQCISVCTPSGLHGEMAIAAMESQKHVIVEKPLEISLEKIDAMIRTSEETGMTLAGIFNYRFNSASIRLKKAVEEGKLGTLVLGDAYIKWFRSQDYYESEAWRGTWELDGGGALMNQSVHFIDLLQWIMGPVQSVSAHIATRAHSDLTVEDVSTATLQFKNGALGTIVGSTAIKPGCPGKLEIHGTLGTVVIEENQISRWNLDGQEELSDQRAGSAAADDPAKLGLEGHEAEIAHIADAILAEQRPAVDGPAARHAVEIILAIYQSAAQGNRVEL